jgi:hypothetical protein
MGMDNKDMLEKDISRYVRTELFPKLKFVMHKTWLVFSTDPVTLCALICKDFGMVKPTTAAAWCERYKGMMADVLNAKQADVTGALKKAFLCKYTETM